MRNLRHQSTRRGFALLLVLIIVSFAAAIAVLFLLSAKQERSGTDSYAQGSRVRQMADTAVNIVMGQINDATREGTAATPVSWASQPGMIRTYTNSGTLSHAYKLYSWSSLGQAPMIEAGAAFNPTSGSTTEFPPNNWTTLPSQYTDLNAPVTTSNPAGGTVQVYPIMDPTIANFTTASFSATPSVSTPGSVTWDFPRELSVATDAAGYVASATNTLPMPVQWLYVLQDGTWIYPSGVSGSTVTFDGAVVTAANPIVGRVAFWTDDETCKVNLNTAGEGAYWDWPKAATSDEMQFAGNPPAKNEFYRISGHPASTSLSAIFPEFTSIGGASGFARWSATGASNPAYLSTLQAIMAGDISALTATGPFSCGLSPRYSYGDAGGAPALTGSRGGTFPAPYNQFYTPAYNGAGNNAPIQFVDGSVLIPVTSYSPVPLNNYRLYATPDELFFAPDPSGAKGRGGTLEVPGAATAGGYENRSLYFNFTGGVPMTPLQLSQRGFLMTTNSKAPETTLFNTPRVSLWPITWPYLSSYFYNDTGLGGFYGGGRTAAQQTAAQTLASTYSPQTKNLSDLAANGTYITPQEDLIGFCSTLNAKATAKPVGSPATYANAPLPYYFQRQSPDSPINDWTNITRNQMLANYIRGEMHQKVPGFGNSLEAKWGTQNADWITLECLDFCRSMVNQTTPNPNDTAGSYLYSFTGISTGGSAGNGATYNDRNAYTSVPLRITPGASTPNFTGTPPTNTSDTTAPSKAAYVTEGSFPSLREVAIMFYATQRAMPTYLGPVGAGPTFTPVNGPAPITNHDHVADPFYWKNLINPGTAYGGIAPPLPTEPQQPDGSDGSDHGLGLPAPGSLGNGASAALETAGHYPVGSQTTKMQAIMLFNFAQLRDGNNVRMKPHFWIKVVGGSNLTVSTAGGPPTPGLVILNSPASVEYRARGGSNQITSQLASKTVNGTLTSGGQTTWTLASSTDITTDPSQATSISLSTTDTTMAFTGGTIFISLYGEYPNKPDTDPTGDSTQFITSYKVIFPGQTLPVPLAPRWNTRQAPYVWYPSNSKAGTFPPPVSPQDPWSWASSEMVPWAPVSSNWGWANAPQWDITDANVRDDPTGTSSYIDPSTQTPGGANGYTYSLDAYGKKNPGLASNAGGPDGQEWMPYAFKGNIPPASVSIPAVTNTAGAAPLAPIDAPFLGSTAYRLIANTDGGVLGPFPITSEGAPLSTGTAAVTESSLFSGGTTGSSSSLQEQAMGRAFVTPYDVVVSAIVDPQDTTTTSNLPHGDPRLVNALGEGTSPAISNSSGQNSTFNSSQVVLGPLLTAGLSANSSPVAPYTGTFLPAQMFNLTLNQQTPKGVTYGSGKTVGAYGFPRMTAGAQFHELGSQNIQLPGFETGYQIFPWWGKNISPAPASGPPNSGVDRTNYMAMEGVYGSLGGVVPYLGSPADIGDMIRVDTNAYMQMNPDWDWTSQEGNSPDGGYVERPDQDYQTFYLTNNFKQGGGTPYFNRFGIAAASNGLGATITMFTPNRQIPSPVVLGTLPSSLTQGWQTLCFSPNPALQMDGGAHPGVGTLAVPNPAAAPYTGAVPDHLLLDLFWMPVGEPYPISEQFSTSGKINLNYAMMPFAYIQRKTGLDAVLKSVMIYAMPDTNTTTGQHVPQDYKSFYYASTTAAAASPFPAPAGRAVTNSRLPINVDATLNAFDYKFNNGDIFRSASQICDMFLYPNNTTTPNTLPTGMIADLNGSIANISSWWQTHGRLTSGNGRQAPYNAIYSRITTQSNTYTVHWKVQALHQLAADVNASPPQWTEGVDRVVSELRGSTLIERYIDPNAGATAANSLPDYADPIAGPTANPITYFYKWRIDNETYFQPGP